MKTAVSSVCVRALSLELSGRLSGAFFDKAYQMGEKEMMLTFRKPGEGSLELVCAPNFICLTSYKRAPPKTPTSFAMQLRKELSGGKVAGVRQHAFDRIIEIDFTTGGEGRTLACELFSKGNMLLLNGERKIIGLLEWQKWKDRKLGVGQQYEHPPAGGNPTELDEDGFQRLMSESGKDLVRTLAVDAGLGGTFAEEVCLRAKVEKNKGARELSKAERSEIHSTLKKLLGEVEKGEHNPRIVSSDGCRIDVTPFALEVYEGKNVEEFKSINEAVDEYFSTLEKTAAEGRHDKVFSDELGKLQAIEKKQEETLAKAREDAGKNKQTGDLIYANIREIEEITEAIKKGRDKKLTDEEITKKLKKATKLVKKIEKNKLTLELE